MKGTSKQKKQLKSSRARKAAAEPPSPTAISTTPGASRDASGVSYAMRMCAPLREMVPFTKEYFQMVLLRPSERSSEMFDSVSNRSAFEPTPGQ
ncbi:hypothetical protein SK128_016668 [Halocaridina rubra]|uniref:Uncharacterized protein n=1 Tax=Halocaridina rubra TaxID=373956 RepID=A0AAN9AC82_HALRR